MGRREGGRREGEQERRECRSRERFTSQLMKGGGGKENIEKDSLAKVNRYMYRGESCDDSRSCGREHHIIVV